MIQWVVSAYTLTFAAFMLISGRLADMYHPKPVFIAGFLIIGVLAIPIGASPQPILTIVLRAIQGIGAAMNVPTGMAMISMIFSDPIEKGRAFAVYGMFGAVGNVSGLIIGGLLTAKASWRWGAYILPVKPSCLNSPTVFYLLSIIVVPVGIASWFIIPSHRGYTTAKPAAKKSLDFPGVLSMTIALVLFVFGISSGSGPGTPLFSSLLLNAYLVAQLGINRLKS